MSAIDDLTQAIQDLRNTIVNAGGGSGGTSGSSIGVTAGITESLLTNGTNPLIGVVRDAGNKLSEGLESVWEEVGKAGDNFENQWANIATAMEQAQLGIFKGGMSIRDAFAHAAHNIALHTNEWGREAESITNKGARDKSLKEAAKVEEEANEKKKKSTWSLGNFDTILNRCTLAIGGLAAAGLSGTVEGYKLKTSFERLGYQLADAMKPAIDVLTTVVAKTAATIRDINQNHPVMRNILGLGLGALIGDRVFKGLFGVSGLGLLGKGAMGAARFGWNNAPGAAAATRTGLAAVGEGWAGVEAGIGTKALYGGATAGILLSTTAMVIDGINKTKGFNDAFRQWKWRDSTNGQEGGWYYPGAAARESDKVERTALHDPKAYLANLKPEYQDMGREMLKEWGKKHDPSVDRQSWMENYNQGRPSSDHISPLYSTQFSSVQSLWENMQKASTENPGMDEATSYLKDIRDHFYGQDTADRQLDSTSAIGE